MAEIESQSSDLAAEQQTTDGGLAEIAAYENAKGDAPAPRRRRARKAEAAMPVTTTRRRRRGSRQTELLSVTASFGSAGVGDIIDALNVKGNKPAEQSVSNALAAFKKSGAMAHRDGRDIAVPGDPEAVDTAPPAATR